MSKNKYLDEASNKAISSDISNITNSNWKFEDYIVCLHCQNRGGIKKGTENRIDTFGANFQFI